jgi:putative transport protein
MIETARELLEASPMLALVLAIGIRYALGQVPILGLTSSAGAVLHSAERAASCCSHGFRSCLSC